MNKKFSICLLCLVAFGTYFTSKILGQIEYNLTQERSLTKMTRGDAGHYIQISNWFMEGDFSMEYTGGGMAHRQPLYPAFLALYKLLFGDTVFVMSMVNLTFYFLIGIVVGLFAFIFYQSLIVSLSVAVFAYTTPFLVNNVTGRLLTEPLFILLSVIFIPLFILFFKTKNFKYLYGASFFAALCYLTRPNGLFMGLLLVAGVACYFLIVSLYQKDWRPVKKSWMPLVLVSLIFVAFTTPSWVPRLVHAGNPIFHSYLPNYLWVDTYIEGHVGGKPRYSMAHYFETHGFTDVVERICYGFDHTFIFSTNREFRKHHKKIALITFLLAMLSRSLPFYILFLYNFVLLLPIVWTMMSNPTPRIAAAVMLPFILYYFSQSLHFLLSKAELLKKFVPLIAGKSLGRGVS